MILHILMLSYCLQASEIDSNIVCSEDAGERRTQICLTCPPVQLLWLLSWRSSFPIAMSSPLLSSPTAVATAPLPDHSNTAEQTASAGGADRMQVDQEGEQQQSEEPISPEGPDDDGDDEEKATSASVSTSAWTAKKRAYHAPTPPAFNPVWSPVDLTSFRREFCDASTHVRKQQQVIKEGDSVIAYESRISMTPVVLKKGAVLGNRFGNFHHIDMIGQRMGAKIAARGKQKGWIVLLPFAPDLWTNSLTHRTQILYQADIAYILFALDLKPGDVVFESGTGSGSLTTALATTIAPHGHVHTFEFNADRVQKARSAQCKNEKVSHLYVRLLMIALLRLHGAELIFPTTSSPP